MTEANRMLPYGISPASKSEIDHMCEIYIKGAISRRYVPSQATLDYYAKAGKWMEDKSPYIRYQFKSDYNSQIYMSKYVYNLETI